MFINIYNDYLPLNRITLYESDAVKTHIHTVYMRSDWHLPYLGSVGEKTGIKEQPCCITADPERSVDSNSSQVYKVLSTTVNSFILFERSARLPLIIWYSQTQTPIDLSLLYTNIKRNGGNGGGLERNSFSSRPQREFTNSTMTEVELININ